MLKKRVENRNVRTFQPTNFVDSCKSEAKDTRGIKKNLRFKTKLTMS